MLMLLLVILVLYMLMLLLVSFVEYHMDTPIENYNYYYTIY